MNAARWRERHPDACKAQNAKKTKEENRAAATKSYWKHVERNREKARARRRISYYLNPEAEVEKSTQYRKRNLAKVQARLRTWASHKRATDVQFRIKNNLRRRLAKAINASMPGSAKKTVSAVRDLGCSIEQLTARIEMQFTAGMAWDNYGSVWNIDHIRALSEFNLADAAQAREASHYTNLQPMYVVDNIKKGGLRRPSPQPIASCI